MGVPQGERIGIARRDRERIDERGRRTMAQPAGVVEPAQAVGDRGHAHKDEGNGGRQGDDGEGEHGRRSAGSQREARSAR
jgi:hypothetical protein